MTPADRSHSTKLAVMISGGGRTLENLAGSIERGDLNAEIVLVIASKECPGAQKALARGMPVLVVPGEIPRETLGRILRDHGVEWVALGGYVKLVRIPEGYEGRVVNIHPALLPEFGGKGFYGGRVHEAVLASGAEESGCTVHIADEEFDHGPILAQARCPVEPGDTPETLAARVFELECELYPRVLGDLFAGRLDPSGASTRTGAR